MEMAIYSTNCDMNTMNALQMVNRMYENTAKIVYSDVALNSMINLNANEIKWVCFIKFSKVAIKKHNFRFAQLFDSRIQLNGVAEALPQFLIGLIDVDAIIPIR